MKKTTLIAAFLMILVLCVTAFAACNKEPIKVLNNLSVDASNAKLFYFVGDDFNPDGIVVKATMLEENVPDPYDVTLTADQYQIDSSAFSKTAAGNYTIVVSYTYGTNTKTAEYTVTVKPTNYDGLIVTLAAGVFATKTVQAGGTVEIDTSEIVVKEVDGAGNVMDGVLTDYTVKLYKGTEEIALTNGKATVGVGEYQIWVSKLSDRVPDYVREAFVRITVKQA